MLKTILVPLDLTPGGDRVLERLGTLALADGVQVRLLHVVPAVLPAGLRRAAQDDARRRLATIAERTRARLPGGATIGVEVVRGLAATEIAAAADRCDAELVVVGRGQGRGLKEALFGSTASRIVRQAHRPALLVRATTRGPYRRPLAAVDLDGSAGLVLPMLRRVLPAPWPRLPVLHAYEAPFERTLYPSLSGTDARGFRDTFRRKHLAALERELHRATRDDGAGAMNCKAIVRNGSARGVIVEAVKRHAADLLALGTHAYAPVAHAFLGTVAGDVLRDVPCDVLVVPPAAPAR